MCIFKGHYLNVLGCSWKSLFSNTFFNLFAASSLEAPWSLRYCKYHRATWEVGPTAELSPKSSKLNERSNLKLSSRFLSIQCLLSFFSLLSNMVFWALFKDSVSWSLTFLFSSCCLISCSICACCCLIISW